MDLIRKYIASYRVISKVNGMGLKIYTYNFAEIRFTNVPTLNVVRRLIILFSVLYFIKMINEHKKI